MSLLSRRFLLTGLMLFSSLAPVSAWADRIVTIDMRNGVKAEHIQAYRLAVLGGKEATHARVIRLLISSKTGFDAGVLEIPKYRRTMNIWVHIYVFHGQHITAPLRVNLFSIDSRMTKHINLEVALR